MFTRIYNYLLHILFPRCCVCCHVDLAWDNPVPLCPACAALLKEPGPLICARCGRVLPSGGAHCFACRGRKGETYKCKVIRSAFVFNEPVRCLVHALKYRQAQYLARYMGEQMVRRWENIPELAGVNYVVPVPLFKKRYRRRGFNQSESLAQALARQLSLPLDTSCLQRIRDTSSQTKLGRIQRMQNMQGAFACSDNGKVKGKIVLLVDDVCTTGATLEACAVALRAAGAKRVMAFTYARE